MYNCINTTKLQKMHEELQIEYAGGLGNRKRICERKSTVPKEVCVIHFICEGNAKGMQS